MMYPNVAQTKLAKLVHAKDTDEVLRILVGGKVLLHQGAELLLALRAAEAKSSPASPGFRQGDYRTVL